MQLFVQPIYNGCQVLEQSGIDILGFPQCGWSNVLELRGVSMWRTASRAVHILMTKVVLFLYHNGLRRPMCPAVGSAFLFASQRPVSTIWFAIHWVLVRQIVFFLNTAKSLNSWLVPWQLILCRWCNWSIFFAGHSASLIAFYRSLKTIFVHILSLLSFILYLLSWWSAHIIYLFNYLLFSFQSSGWLPTACYQLFQDKEKLIQCNR